MDGLSLQIPVGARFGIVGANGAGKTTLMRMLSTALKPQSGSLEILGIDALSAPRLVKAQLGVVPQGITLDTEIGVTDNIVTFGRYHGLSRTVAAERADELLEIVGLGGHRDHQVGQLSGGMQRRLLIARSLVADPKLVLLDEPTTGLDPEGRLVVADLIAYGRLRRSTVIITSHYLDEVERLCDEVLVLDHGRRVRQGRPRELIEHSLPRYAIELPSQAGPVDPAVLDRLGSEVRHARYGDRRLVFTAEPESATARLRAAGFDDLLVRPSNLEDALLAIRSGTVPASCKPVIGYQPGLAAAELPSQARATSVLGRARWARAGMIWERNFRLFLRNYSTTVLPNFLEPVFLLLALGLSLGHYVDRTALGGSYSHYLAPGLLAVAAANGAIFEVTYNIFVRLRHLRLYEAVVTTPVSSREVAVGELLWSLTRAEVYGTAFLLVITAFGLSDSRAFVLPLVFPVIGLPFACLGLIFTSRARAIGEYAYFYAMFLIPLTLFSGIYYPIDRFGRLGRALTWFSPLQHSAALIRTILDGQLASAGGHLVWLLTVGLLLLAPALRSLSRAVSG